MKEVKNGRSKAYAMDGAALKKIFEKRGINPRQFSKELGYHETYFPKCIRQNYIGEKAIGMLMSKKILPSQYGVENMAPAKNVKEEVNEATDKKDWLHYDGVKKNSGRYPWGDEAGVVKLEFSIDILKLKAIIKQAVKEAYEEL